MKQQPPEMFGQYGVHRRLWGLWWTVERLDRDVLGVRWHRVAGFRDQVRAVFYAQAHEQYDRDQALYERATKHRREYQECPCLCGEDNGCPCRDGRAWCGCGHDECVTCVRYRRLTRR